MTFRSLPRPSSALGAKASTVCPYLLDLRLTKRSSINGQSFDGVYSLQIYVLNINPKMLGNQPFAWFITFAFFYEVFKEHFVSTNALTVRVFPQN